MPFAILPPSPQPFPQPPPPNNTPSQPQTQTQVIKQEEQWARAAFYEKQGIAFVARPPLGRRGVFKKASNLNYQLAVTDRVCALTADGLTPTQALMKVCGRRVDVLLPSLLSQRQQVWYT